jgi:hypothetical protein
MGQNTYNYWIENMFVINETVRLYITYGLKVFGAYLSFEPWEEENSTILYLFQKQ